MIGAPNALLMQKILKMRDDDSEEAIETRQDETDELLLCLKNIAHYLSVIAHHYDENVTVEYTDEELERAAGTARKEFLNEFTCRLGRSLEDNTEEQTEQGYRR